MYNAKFYKGVDIDKDLILHSIHNGTPKRVQILANEYIRTVI